MAGALSFDDAFDELIAIIREQEVIDWVVEKLGDRTEENLVFLTKFAYMTGLINKADIKRYLDVDAKEAKKLVKQWYDEHREKGCGIC